MIKKTSTTLGAIMLLVIVFLPLWASAQAPQKFGYQAVIRNENNELVTDQNVRMLISILKGSSSGETVYTENQSATTNMNGLVSIEIGTGNVVTGVFADIDWNDDTYFIKTETDPAGGNSYSITGVSQLVSVPYAMYSNESLNAKSLRTGGVYSTDTDTLFVVKDHDGNVVFVVFPDGAQLIVDESAKGKVGGFAVSGRTAGKASTDSYLQVTRDSTRIYIVENPLTKGKVGGFAVSGRTAGKGSATDYLNVSGSTEAEIIDPSEPRILWYPVKEAFLAGRVLVESPDSVGTNSLATGFESKSIGNYSQALGYQARAFGLNSTAIGNNANAIGSESYALGNFAETEGDGSYAFGSGAKAVGTYSFAMGSIGVDTSGSATNPTLALADHSYAFGMGSVANNRGAFAFGTMNTASGEFSTAMGSYTEASSKYSTAIGFKSEASGQYGGSIAIGYFAKATGSNSIAIGSYATASNSSSVALGFNVKATGEWGGSVALGNNTIASGSNATAMGITTTASASMSTAMGYRNTARGGTSTVMGCRNTARSAYETVIGYVNDTTFSSDPGAWVDTDPLFIIGNGEKTGSYPNFEYIPSNALMVLKNGNCGIGGYPGGDGSNVLAIKGGINPGSEITDGILLYADTIGGINAELIVLDESGNTTTLSPHNFSLTQKSEPMAWSFFSENKNLGYKINVDMLKAIRTIEKLSGEQLVYLQDLESNEVITNDEDVSLLEIIEQQNAKIDELRQKVNKLMELLENR